MSYSNWQYKNKISFIVCIFAFIPMLILSGIFLFGSYNGLKEQVMAEEGKNLAAYAQLINKLVDECEQKSEFINTSREIRLFMQKEQPTLIQQLDFIHYFEELIETLRVGISPLFINIISMRSTEKLGSHYIDWETFLQGFSEDEHAMIEKIEKLSLNEMLWVFRGRHLYLYSEIEDLSGKIGVVELSLPVSHFENLYEDGLLSGEGILLYMEEASQSNIIGSVGYDWKNNNGNLLTKEWFILEEEIYNLPGKVQLIIKKAIIQERIQWMLLINTLGVFLLLVGIFAIIRFISNSMAKKMTQLIDNINQNLKELMKDDDLNIYDNEDFRIIGQKIYDLIRMVKEYSIKIQKFETEKVQLELELLQARFDPHFLYNTLGTLRYLVADPDIKESIESLISYYRIVLSKGSLIIPIFEEVKLIEKYVQLQKFTYAMSIRFHLEIQEEVNQYTIIKHILQPIIENAMMHGLKALDTEGELLLRAHKEENIILFEIIDNGHGMTKEMAETLLREPKSKEDGYGMYNVQKRIQVYYGNKYGLQITSEPMQGTRVTMKIPAVKETAPEIVLMEEK